MPERTTKSTVPNAPSEALTPNVCLYYIAGSSLLRWLSSAAIPKGGSHCTFLYKTILFAHANKPTGPSSLVRPVSQAANRARKKIWLLFRALVRITFGTNSASSISHPFALFTLPSSFIRGEKLGAKHFRGSLKSVFNLCEPHQMSGHGIVTPHRRQVYRVEVDEFSLEVFEALL